MKIPLSHIAEGLCIEIIGESEDSLKEISNLEAEKFGESAFQIKEGYSYEYKFNNSDYRLTDEEKIVSVSKFDTHTGRLNPNIYVGTLTLEVLGNDLKPRGKFNIEVESVKSEYREDYRYMLKCITDKCTDLIMQIDSPVNQYFETNFDVDNQTLYQRFCFVKSEIDAPEFEEAIQKIVASPTTKWEDVSEEKDVRNVKRFNQKNIKQLVSKSNRMPLPSSHVLSQKHDIRSVPVRIESIRKTESIDNGENRFIKHALKEFLSFCENCEEKFEKYSRAKLEANVLANKLSNFLNQSFFKEISRPAFLKLNSPVLQRKSGYREVLNTWLKYDLAAKLVWNGGDNVYKGGKKDIATLYEYWLFFSLLDILKDKEVFNIEPKAIHELIQFDKDRLSLNLKQGQTIALKGIYKSPFRNLNVQFSYNKSFGGGKIYPNAGSYTTTLRPDYTLSLWPAEILDIKEAERQELITHIHFDAKYKVNNFYALVKKAKEEELTDDENKELIDEEEQEKKGNFKNIDLLKMHAYKDAIRRTGGAYVLYPGEGKDDPFRGFRELIPGLGAFVMKPTKEHSGKEELKSFILKVVNHFLDRSSQRENITSKIYEVHKEEKKDDNILNEPMPEFIDGHKLIPDETYVIVGFSKNNTRFTWYEDKCIYNFRMNEEKGSLVLDNQVVNAKYLLLRKSGSETTSEIYKIVGKGPKVYSYNQLKELDYPFSDKPKDYYLVVEFEKVNPLDFGNSVWRFKELDNYKKIFEQEKNPRIASGIPFTVTLKDLMKTEEKFLDNLKK